MNDEYIFIVLPARFFNPRRVITLEVSLVLEHSVIVSDPDIS